MLQIDLDINDSYLSDPGLSVIDPAASFAPVIQQTGASSPYFLTPSGNALMLRPLQLTPEWPSAVKFRAGDYGSPSGWEEQLVRAEGDWFMHSTGPVTPLTLGYTFPANTGWFIEFRAYALPKSPPVPIFDFAFGQFFELLVNSAGDVNLYDSRLAGTEPIGSGNIAGFNSFENRDISLVVLPYRRQQILVWSPNRGGYFDAAVTIGSQNTITQPGAPTLYRTVTPPAALVAITPLLYPADSVPSITAPTHSLAYPLTQNPSFTGSVSDQNETSPLSITSLTPFVPGSTVTKFAYAVTMSGNVFHQTAEQQGVLGIAAQNDTSSGDSLFAGSEYPYSLTTPFLYFTIYGYPRTLSPVDFSATTLTGILDATLTLSRDRAAKSFAFVVDNPGNITGLGVNYDDLRNLQNRRCRAYLTNSSLEAGASIAAIAADPDPDTPLIIANGNSRVYIFDGYTDQPEFVDGVSSRLSFRCLGLRKKLRNYIFYDQPLYDGMAVNDVITDILQRAGFVADADTAAGLSSEIYCQPNTIILPAAVPGDEPLFVPAIGTSAEEFIDILTRCTGWVLDDLIGAGESNSSWYWTDPDFYATSVYSTQGSPVVALTSTELAALSVSSLPLPDLSEPNQGINSLVMLASSPPKQSLEELIANDIYVVGVDNNGHLIVGHARDDASISDSSALNYVGEVRTYLLICQWINTVQILTEVLAILFNTLTKARTHLTFTIPDYYPQLGISAPLTIAGYWDSQIDGIVAELGSLRGRKTHVTVMRTN